MLNCKCFFTFIIPTRFYEELLQAGILKPFPGKIEGQSVSDDQSENFMAPQGMNSVVKHFFSSSGNVRVMLDMMCIDRIGNWWVRKWCMAQNRELGNILSGSYESCVKFFFFVKIANFLGRFQNFLRRFSIKRFPTLQGDQWKFQPN